MEQVSKAAQDSLAQQEVEMKALKKLLDRVSSKKDSKSAGKSSSALNFKKGKLLRLTCTNLCVVPTSSSCFADALIIEKHLKSFAHEVTARKEGLA